MIVELTNLIIRKKEKDELEQEQNAENVEPEEDVELNNVSIIEAENNVQPSPQSGWYKDSKFDGVDTKSLFENYFSHRYNTRELNKNKKPTRVGIQVSVNSANSPMKAWKQIFTDKILNFVVKQTNEYGSVVSKFKELG